MLLWNFALIGSPGSGKSTLAREYSQQMGARGAQLRVLDIDEQVLSPVQGTTFPLLMAAQIGKVTRGAQRVLEDNSNDFIAAQVDAMSAQQAFEWEGRLTAGYPFESLSATIVATTGSNPMRPTVMARIRQFMPTVWIDTPDDEVIARLNAKDPATGTQRIIGMREHGSIEAVLKYRRNFYRAAADLIFTPSAKDPKAILREFSTWMHANQVHEVANIWSKCPAGMTFNDRLLRLAPSLIGE